MGGSPRNKKGTSNAGTSDNKTSSAKAAMREQSMWKQSPNTSDPCDKCNHSVWVRDKMESEFMAHPYVSVAVTIAAIL